MGRRGVIIEDPQYIVRVSFGGNVSNIQPRHISAVRGFMIVISLGQISFVNRINAASMRWCSFGLFVHPFWYTL
jgi:hypothetical protein